MRPTALPCLAVMSIVLLVAADATAQTVTLQREGEQVTIAVGRAAALPADFPADVFLPSPATLVRVEAAGPGHLMLEFTAAGAPANLAERHADAMAASGWTPAQVAPVAGTEVRAWEKDDRAVVLAATPEPDGTRLRLKLLPRRSAPSDHVPR